MTKPAYQRVLLKLSGEALMGDDAFGINRATIDRMVADVAEVAKLGVQVAVVIGGGNIFRGVAPGAQGMDRATADYMGMLATVMNALALADAMRHVGITARVMSATRYESISFDEAIAKHLQVMDATAFALCRDQKLPIKVFSIVKPGALKAVIMGEDEGTLVHV